MLAVQAIGLSTAFGAGEAASLAARAEARSAYHRSTAWIGTDFAPQLCAFRDPLALDGFARRADVLLAEATHDLIGALRAQGEHALAERDVPYLLLALPEPFPGMDGPALEALGAELCAKVQAALQGALGLAPGRVRVGAGGHAGLLAGLRDLAGGEEPDRPLLLAGLDSYADRARLEALAGAGRLFSDCDRWGLVPGEAAGIALCRPLSGHLPAVRMRGRVLGYACAAEPVGELDEAETAHTGLSAACHAACGGLGGRRLTHWVSDWNNGRYRAAELAYAQLRVGGRHGEEALEAEPMALAFGDVGAASPVLGLALALDLMAAEAARVAEMAQAAGAGESGTRARAALVSCSSVASGHRGALVVVPS